ncbi:MAG: hypothetical protein ABIU63_00610 [Chitinophagaceae bacterium]
MGKIFTFFAVCLLAFLGSGAQSFDEKHNPLLDVNLSPQHNNAIHPDHNSIINPKLNWNINPYKNGLINPEKVAAINPKTNNAVNPLQNQEMNPMFSIYMSPKFENWHGMYLFDTNDALIGYVTKYSQDIMIQFDKESNWTFFYLRTAKGTYNQFNLSAEWTGNFLCFDSMSGYNLFDKLGAWTGMHIK